MAALGVAWSSTISGFLGLVRLGSSGRPTRSRPPCSSADRLRSRGFEILRRRRLRLPHRSVFVPAGWKPPSSSLNRPFRQSGGTPGPSFRRLGGGLGCRRCPWSCRPWRRAPGLRETPRRRAALVGCRTPTMWCLSTWRPPSVARSRRSSGTSTRECLTTSSTATTTPSLGTCRPSSPFHSIHCPLAVFLLVDFRRNLVQILLSFSRCERPSLTLPFATCLFVKSTITGFFSANFFDTIGSAKSASLHCQG